MSGHAYFSEESFAFTADTTEEFVFVTRKSGTDFGARLPSGAGVRAVGIL